jgi:sec-independent protein translocase protein TatB
MLDIGWSELLIIGVVALIVVGPKDLPVMFRTFGRFTGKMRGMARDFQRAMDEAAKQSGMDEAARDLKAMTSKKALGLNALESAAAKFEKWDPTKPAARAAAPAKPAEAAKPAAPAPAAPPAAAVEPEKPLGPATRALKDKREADRTARLEAAAKASEPVAEVAKPAELRKPAKVPAGATPAPNEQRAAKPDPCDPAEPPARPPRKAPARKPKAPAP